MRVVRKYVMLQTSTKDAYDLNIYPLLLLFRHVLQMINNNTMTPNSCT